MGQGTGLRGRAARPTLDWVLALGAALVVLLVALLLVQRERELAEVRQAVEDGGVVTDLAVAFHIDLETAVDRATESAGRPIGVQLLAPGVTLDRLDPSAGETDGGALTRDDLERPQVAALVAQAIDTGEVVTSPPVELGAGPRILTIAPYYGPAGPPEDLLGRRSSLQQAAVAVMDVGAMVTPHVPEGSGAVVTIGRTELVGAQGPPHAGASRVVDLHGYRVGIRAGALEAPGLAVTAALLLAGGAGLAVVAGWLVLQRREAQRRQAAAIAIGEAQTELIAEVAPIVQQSLDLADVLPAIAVHLQDRFGLTSVHLAAADPAGGQVQVFGLGPRAAAVPAPALAPPDVLVAGQPLALALQRGGRSVALLEIVAGRDLRSEELRSLRVLTELVTAAVVNANLYASQQDAMRRLRDLDALKTVFLSTASHELRTPATAIGGFASLLEQRWDSFPEERRREMVERIAANARSLSAVVEDLLDFSLLDRREQPLPTTPTDLPALVRGVVERLALLFGQHDIEVRADATPMVAGEHNALERVVTNLLTNAVKFSPPGSHIRVEVGALDGGGVLSVSDEGPGVPEQERARIFTRFYRGAGEAVVQTRGVGIGLSVVAELVDRMAGRVEVGEAPTGGARFTVWLPAAGAQDGDDGPRAAKEVEDAPTT